MPETPSEPTTRAAFPAVGGLVLTLAAVVGYFVVVMRFGAWLPQIRNDPVPNRVVVALGLALALLAVIRASRGRRRLSLILAGVNVVVAGAFTAMLTVGSALPPVTGPPIGQPAPTFALADQSGRTVRLEDYRGAPLLLVFYRGHW
jgi:hypothetical protein